MNFFESELRKLAAACDKIINPVFAGRACFCDLGDGNRAKLEFAIIGTHQKYEALNVKIVNRLDGNIDNLTIRFEDLWGRQQTNNRITVVPHIWTYNEKSEWYAWTPTEKYITQLAAEVGTYLAVFKSRDIVQEKAKSEKTAKTSLIKPLREPNNKIATKNNNKKTKKSEQDL